MSQSTAAETFLDAPEEKFLVGKKRPKFFEKPLAPSLAIILSLILSGLVAFLAFLPLHTDTLASVNAGFVSLSLQNLKSGALELRGDWLFWPSVVINPAISPHRLPEGFQLQPVPAVWGEMSPKGLGTYVCVLDVPEGVTKLELYTTNIGTSGNLYVNGEAVWSAGSFSTDPELQEPSARPIMCSFCVQAGYNVRMFHVSNSVHPKGGLWEPVRVSLPLVLSNRSNTAAAIDLVMLGSLMFISLFLLLLFLLKKENYVYLFFSAAIITVAFGNSIRGNFSMYCLFPTIDYLLLKHLQFILYYLAGGFFMYSASRLMGIQFHRVSRAFFLFCFGLSLLSTVLPFPLMYKLSVLFYPLMGAMFITLFISVYTSPLLDGIERIFWSLANLILMYCTLHDGISTMRSNWDISIVPFGTYLYAILCTVLLARGYINVSKKLDEARSTMISMADTERRRLGQDIHDGIGQSVHAMEYLTQGALSAGEADRITLEKIKALAFDINARFRHIIKGLYPVRGSSADLEAALRSLAEHYQSMWQISVDLDFQRELPALGDSSVTHLYYIASEAMANAVRHAKPSRVSISLFADLDYAVFTCENDGVNSQNKGLLNINFSSIEMSGFHGNGLPIMAWRANALGGKLSAVACSGGLFRVSLSFPIVSKKAGDTSNENSAG